MERYPHDQIDTILAEIDSKRDQLVETAQTDAPDYLIADQIEALDQLGQNARNDAVQIALQGIMAARLTDIRGH